ncbi:MAG: WD40/YVTN/BNR-like repeat-containing protein, partial [bacterium]
MAIDRNNSNYIYAISGGKIIRSTNLGYTWVEITPQPPNGVRCIEIDPFFPQTIYASHWSIGVWNIGLWKSVDAGNTWQYLGFADTVITDIDVSPRDPNIVFCVGSIFLPSNCGYVYKSTNGGTNWHLTLTSGDSERWAHLSISLTSPDTIIAVMPHGHASPMDYSIDEGETWIPFQPAVGWPPIDFAYLSSSPNVDGLFIIKSQQGLFRSPNFINPYGITYNGIRPRYRTTVMSVCQTDDKLLICNGKASREIGSGEIWRTTDCGNSWLTYPEIIYEEERSIEPLAIKILSHDSIYIIGYSTYAPSTYYGFYISADAGITYNLLYPAPDLASFDISNALTVFLIGNSGGCHLWRSEYPYTTWDLKSVALPPKFIIKVHPFNSNILFLGGNNGGFWRSTDGGTTLILSNIGLPTQNNSVSAIATGFSTEDKPITVYCGFQKTEATGIAGLYKSTDLGATWLTTGLTEDVNELKVDPYDPSILYISTPDNIYVSHDYAEHFLTLNQGLNELKSYTLDLSTVRPHLFCGTRHGVFKFSPIMLFSGIPIATGYQASKIIVKDNTTQFAYQTLGGVYFGTSDMAGQRKIRQFGAKDGEFPTLTLDANNNPCVIWQRNIEPTPIQGGGELWFSRYDGTNWTEPHLLASFTGPYSLDVNLPSFIIDHTTNIGYVVFEYQDRFINGPNSHLLLGWFDILNPAAFHYVELEFAPNPQRCEFPSVSLGGNHLYIAFQREHKIYRIKWDKINHQIVNRIQLSRDNRFSHHPFVDVQANGRINYVWEDSTADNIEIYWQYEDSPFSPKNISNTPGKSQWPQICKGTTWITWSEYIWPPTDNNWEICYKDMEYEGYQILSQTLEMSKYSHGVVYRSPYWPPPYEPKLTAIWTEGNQSPYEIRTKTVVLPPIPYFYVDGGKEEPAPWTVQREGYIQFGPEPEKTIDYHSQK